MVVLRSIHEGFGILYFNTKTYMFGVHPQVTAEALPQMNARCHFLSVLYNASTFKFAQIDYTPNYDLAPNISNFLLVCT